MKRLTSLWFFALLAISSCKTENDVASTSASVDHDIKNRTMAANEYRLSSIGAKLQVLTISPENEFAYNGKNVHVNVYSRNVGDTKDSPVFKYGDLLNRAIAYKNAHPATDVQVRFAIYKIGFNSYVGFNPNDASYGYVKGSDHGGESSEKLIYSIVKAALNQVKVDFVYQFDVSESVYNYINGFMENSCFTDPTKKVKDYLRIRKVSWGSEAYQQMHAKFMTVSHFTGDGKDVKDAILSTTANIDDHDNTGIPTAKDWVQSGTLIDGHAELVASFNMYFDLIYANYNNQQNFQQAVRSMHASNTLNFDDQHFSSYFTPIPLMPQGNYVPGQPDSSSAQGNAWDINFNPVAKYVNQMSTVSGDRYLKVNMYHFKMDNFGQKLYNELAGIYNAGTTGLKHFRFLAKTNSYQTTDPLNVFNTIGVMKYPAAVHTKNVTFAFSGISSYYTLTGSTNLKLDENASKANSTLVIKEFTTSHPVYNIFKTIYEYQL